MASYTVSLCLVLPWCHPFSLHHNQGDLFKMQILSVTLLLEIIQWLPSLFWIKTKLLSMRTHLIAPTPISLASLQTISTLDSWLQPFCLLPHGPFSLLTVCFCFFFIRYSLPRDSFFPLRSSHPKSKLPSVCYAFIQPLSFNFITYQNCNFTFHSCNNLSVDSLTHWILSYLTARTNFSSPFYPQQ